MDESKARQMIEDIGEWLRNGAPGSERDPDALAREFSDDLLADGNADGLGGCPLCQS